MSDDLHGYPQDEGGQCTSRYQNTSVRLTYVKKDTNSVSFLDVYVQNQGNLCQKVTYLCQNADKINVGPKPNGHIHMSNAHIYVKKSIHFCQIGHLFMSKFTHNFCQK